MTDNNLQSVTGKQSRSVVGENVANSYSLSTTQDLAVEQTASSVREAGATKYSDGVQAVMGSQSRLDVVEGAVLSH